MISWVLRNVTLIDGTDAPPTDDVDISVNEGRIAAIGTDLPAPAGALEIDGAGTWVIPGLVDAHVHLMTIPGETWLAPTEAERDALVQAHLRAYLACGVTTVLDVGTVPERMARIREMAPAPQILMLGRVWGPSRGYPSNYQPDAGHLDDRASVRAALDENVALGAVGAKLTFERGFAKHDAWPLFDADQRTAIREEAAARGLPLFVHAMTPSEFVPAAELSPRAFVHGPEFADPEVTRVIEDSGAYVVTTLSIYDAPLLPMDRRAWSDPWLVARVPEVERLAALDRRTTVAARQGLGEMVLPNLPRWISGMGVGARMVTRHRLREATGAVRALHEAGVPLVIGTDSGTWPVFHTHFHGPSTVRELELLARAGLSPTEVLRAGTANAARLLGRTDFGTVHVGNRADLVVLGADPLTDPTAYREIRYTAAGGRIHTPAEWLDPG